MLLGHTQSTGAREVRQVLQLAQATAPHHYLNPVLQAQSKAPLKVLRRHILRQVNKQNNKTAYLGYFHKMAQDFCPYF
jgi:hypothetical protein